MHCNVENGPPLAFVWVSDSLTHFGESVFVFIEQMEVFNLPLVLGSSLTHFQSFNA